MLGCPAGSINPQPATGGVECEDGQFSPFWHLTLPNDDVARRLAERCLLVKGVYELWGEGSTMAELVASIAACPEHIKAPVLQSDATFRVNVSGWGKKITMEEQTELIEQLDGVDFRGKVRLKNPQHTMQMYICNPNRVDDTDDGSEDDKAQLKLGVPNIPFRMYFGREIGVSAATKGGLLERYSLKRRLYLGPTSMDAEMAFLMCSMAQVQKGHFVCDPFAGTGSILIAAAHYGASVFGGDIDARVIKVGKEDKRGGEERLTIYTNFKQYGFTPPTALVRMDLHLHPLRPGLEEIFHSVICDPPYGVRAGGRKSQYKDTVIMDRATHFTSTAPYGLGECLRDLLDFCARLLIVGGRLVYFLPATHDTYKEEDIPAHPALQLVANSEQTLNFTYSRRLITMQKVHCYDAAAAAAYHAAHPDPSMPIDHMHAIVHPTGSSAAASAAAVSARAAAAAAAATSAGGGKGTGVDHAISTNGAACHVHDSSCSTVGRVPEGSGLVCGGSDETQQIADMVPGIEEDRDIVVDRQPSVSASVTSSDCARSVGKGKAARKPSNNFRGKQV